MIYLEISAQVEKANEAKNKAIGNSANFPYFLEAALAFQGAYDQLQEETNVSEFSFYKQQYRTWFTYWLVYQYNDCMYDYHKVQKEYDQATPFFERALSEINKLHDRIKINLQLLAGADDFDPQQYQEFKVRIDYNYLSYQLKLNEFPAKRYFEEKQYFLALQKYHACLRSFDVQADYMIASKNYFDDGYLRTHALNKSICAINYSMCLIGSIREHHFVKDAYYALSIVINLLNAYEKAGEILIISPNDEKYKDGYDAVFQAIEDTLYAHQGFWSVILDKLRDNPLVNSLMGKINPELFAKTKQGLSVTPPRTVALVFMVHGFNTRGEWKSTLTSVLTSAESDKRFIPENFDYGDFFLQFIKPPSRARVIKEFKDFYNQRMSIYYNLNPEAYLVAHSFGTFLTGENIMQFPEVNFEKIIYAGSILKRDFKWLYAQVKKPNLQVRFELQRTDWALRGAYLYSRLPWINWLGDSGRRGFLETYDFIDIHNYLYGGHSDMFGEVHMRKNWLPFLLA